MDSTEILKLDTALSKITKPWKNIDSKKMFGCPAYWVNGNVFALVWKQGRIGVKLTDPADYDALLSKTGAEPWKAGPMTMSHWVLLPKTFHSDAANMKRWLQRAYDLNEKVPEKAAKKKTSKKINKKN